MVNKIYISYDNNEIVTFSFWKQFFLMSGIWVIGNEIEDIEKDNFEEMGSEYLHLYLLSKTSLPIIKRSILKDNVFYFIHIRHYKDDKLYQSRKDVLVYDWRKRSTFIYAIEQIISEEYENYRNLLNIYINNSLWLSSWLYFELAYEEKTEWDAWILKNSIRAIKSLRKFRDKNAKVKNLWNYKFMNLYCDYLNTAIEDRNLENRKIKVQNLLQKANLLSSERGWKPALCDLCAKISMLSPLENKVSILYYGEIPDYEEEAEILYKIGKVYEKNYGDIEKAMKYYRLADEDNKYYRAKYKIASYYEKKGEWKQALFLYENIMEQIRHRLKSRFYYSITVYDVEYYEKTLIKTESIFQQKFLYSGHELENLIENVKTNMSEFSCLTKMIHCMRMMSDRNSIMTDIDRRDDDKKSENQREADFLKNIMEYVQKRIDSYF